MKKEVIALDDFLTNMKGETRMHVEALMAQLGEAQALLEEKEEEISKLQEHRLDYANEICGLSQ